MGQTSLFSKTDLTKSALKDRYRATSHEP